MLTRLAMVWFWLFASVAIAQTQHPTSLPSEGKTTKTTIISDDPNIKKLYEMTILICGGDNQNDLRPLGSGFFFTENGYILTASHVVHNPRTKRPYNEYQLHWERTHAKVALVLPGPFTLTTLSGILSYDVAVLKIELTRGKTPFLPLGDSTHAHLGDDVLCMGYPLGGDLLVDQEMFCPGSAGNGQPAVSVSECGRSFL